MSNTIGYSLGCVTPVRYNLTQGGDVTGNGVSFSLLGCAPGCWNGDYRDRSYWGQLSRSETAVTGGTDYYGARAPTTRYLGGGTYRDICPTVCFCEGPVDEGETVTEYLGRYETRWMALIEEGIFYYGREGGTLVQAPLGLFPDPLPTATHIALAFDANARPIFAYEDDTGAVYVRRYVAGVPTTYTWAGISPCLFFNGVVESDDSKTDVVCYYLLSSGGALYARIQRENFGVANLVLEDAALDSLLAVDRGRGALASYMVMELRGKRVFAAAYPPWPILMTDMGGVSAAVLGIEYAPVSVFVGEYPEPVSVSTTVLAIEYFDTVIEFPSTADGGSVATDIDTIDYFDTVVDMGSYSETASALAEIASLDYPIVAVPVGTYTETASVSAEIASIAYVSS